jgi:hypothetical protein
LAKDFFVAPAVIRADIIVVGAEGNVAFFFS